MRNIIFLSFLLVSVQLFSQTPKENYQKAEEYFTSGDHTLAIQKLKAVESSLGKSNAVIEHLRVKCYFELKDWENAETHLKPFFSFKASKTLSDEMLDYAQQLQDRRFQITQTKLKQDEKELNEISGSLEREMKTTITTVKKENETVHLAKVLKSGIETTLNDFSMLEEGKPYIITSRKNLTSSFSERSVIIFFGNSYIIYTVPSISLIEKLFKNKVTYTSQDAKSGTVTLTKTMRNSFGNKEEVSFRKGLHFSNIF